jgi:hypothetical protein
MSIGGSSHTVTINTATKIGLVVFDGLAGQKVSLVLTSSTFSGSLYGGITIYKPDGTQLTNHCCLSAGLTFDTVLPTVGTYTILIDPAGTETGSMTLLLSEDLSAGSIVINGESVTVTISRAGQRGYLTFDGTAGQKVNLGVNSSTFANCSWLGILKPDGTTLASNNCFGTGTNLNTTLPVTGTYTVLIDPVGTSTGSTTLMLSEEAASRRS